MEKTLFFLRKTSQWVYKVTSHRYFFFAVVTLAVLQGLWVALTFTPALFDEGRHLQFITFYTHTLNPFIAHQTPNLDYMGQVSREPSFLYYYIMSWPLRLFQFIFGSHIAPQIILLRFISIGLFVISLFLYRKFFREQNVSSAIINFSLLALLLIPGIAPLIGVVSYDTGVLPLIILMLIYTMRIIKSRKINLRWIVILVVIVCVASVVKYTSLPIAAVCFIAILFHVIALYRNKRQRLLKDILTQYNTISVRSRILLLIALVVSLGVFVERPVQNILVYKNISPSCFDVVPKKDANARCIKNYVYARDIEFLAEKPLGFKPVDQVKFFLNTWLIGMHDSMIQQYPNVLPLSPMVWTYYVLMFGGVVVILLAGRELLRSRSHQFMIAVGLIYALSVYYSNYKGYAHLAQPVAITARYLLPILPICIYLTIVSIQIIVGQSSRKYLPLLVIPYLLVSTQGGGLITHLVSADSSMYWKNSTIETVNTTVKKILLHLTKE